MAACERLVLLCGDACPWERRDLAALYCHLGLFRGGGLETEFGLLLLCCTVTSTPDL